MNVRQLASVALSFAAGIVVASLFHADAKRKLPSSPQEAEATLSGDAAATVAALRGEYERAIAELKTKNESLRLQVEKGGILPGALTPEEARRYVAELGQKRRLAADDRKTAALLAAGFSSDRIAWLERRSEVLALEFRQKEDRLRQLGKNDMNAHIAHFIDQDIDLRREIGDEEYAKYREALGRGSGLKVGEVVAGGIGEAAGLKPGDEILAYNGNRIFNIGELHPLVARFMRSGTSLVVEVLRDGEKVRLNAAAGDLRITNSMGLPPPLPRGLEALNAGARSPATR